MYKMEYYSVPKKNGITKLSGKWIIPKYILLNKFMKFHKENKSTFPHK